MFIVITLRKEIPDRETARLIYDVIKAKMADRPDIVLTGHCSNHFDFTEDLPA